MAVQNQSGSYHVDLSRVRYFTPFAACYVVALVLELLKRSYVDVTTPDDENARHQIDYLGVKSFFTQQPLRRSKRVRAVPMAHLSEPNYDKAGELSKLTAESLDLPKSHFYLSIFASKNFSKILLNMGNQVLGLLFVHMALRTEEL